MKIENIQIIEIEAYEKNPRKISNEALNKIKKSIESFGFVNPIIGWRNKNNKVEIVAGHQRLKAAIKLKLKSVPVIIYPFKNEKDALAYNIADNRLNELSTWDYNLLKDTFELLDTGEYDVELTGFSEIEIEALMGFYKDPPFTNIIKDSVKEITIKLYLSDIEYEIFSDAVDFALFGKDIKAYDKAMRKSFEIIDSRKRGEALAKICKDWLEKCADVV